MMLFPASFGRCETVSVAPQALVSFHAIDAADDRSGGIDYAESLLDADEARRAGRLRPAQHRAQWVVAHAVQRQQLASFLRCAPHEVRYQRSSSGRPSLVSAHNDWESTDFNISHSGDILLLGITDRGRIGVDVEGWMQTDRTPHWASLSDRESRWVAGQADPFAAFIRLWTRKEAIVKALGTGLPDHLAALDVLMPTDATNAVICTPWGEMVRVVDLPSPPRFHAAAAVTALDVMVRVVADAPPLLRLGVNS